MSKYKCCHTSYKSNQPKDMCPQFSSAFKKEQFTHYTNKTCSSKIYYLTTHNKVFNAYLRSNHDKYHIRTQIENKK